MPITRTVPLATAYTLLGQAQHIAKVQTSPAPSVLIKPPALGLPLEEERVPATPVGGSGSVTVEAKEGALSFGGILGDLSTPLAPVAGYRYGVQTDNHLFTVEVAGGDASSVQLKHPLPVDVPAGSSIFSLMLSVDITATDFVDVGTNGLLKWEATVGTLALRWDQTFSVVDAAVVSPVTTADLIPLWPEARRMISSEDGALEGTLTAAWALYVEPELKARGVYIDGINDTNPLIPMVVAACKLVAYEGRNPEETIVIDSLNRRFLAAVTVGVASDTWWAAPLGLDAEVEQGGESFGRIRRGW